MPESPRADADAPLFRERLLPGPGTWIVLVAFGLLLGPVIVPFPAWAAISLSTVALLTVITLAVIGSPVVEVVDGELRAGRAHAPVRLFEEPELLDPQAWKQAMGTGFAPLEHHVTRGWIGQGVRLPLSDPEDPTPAWVISVRRPEELVAALRAAAAIR